MPFALTPQFSYHACVRIGPLLIHSFHFPPPRYLKLLCGVSDDWLVTAPLSIKLATALGIISSALLTHALWPVFGMVTLPLLFLLLLGFIEVWHFIPTP